MIIKAHASADVGSFSVILHKLPIVSIQCIVWSGILIFALHSIPWLRLCRVNVCSLSNGVSLLQAFSSLGIVCHTLPAAKDECFQVRGTSVRFLAVQTPKVNETHVIYTQWVNLNGRCYFTHILWVSVVSFQTLSKCQNNDICRLGYSQLLLLLFLTACYLSSHSTK